MGIATAIGGALALGGSLLSSSSSNRNSRRAAETSQQNNAQNTALAREIYNSNRTTLNPFVQRGNAAGDQINAMLGLGGAPQAAQTPTAQPNAISQFRGPTPFGGAGAPYGIADGISPWSISGDPVTGRYNPLSFGNAFTQAGTTPPAPTAQEAAESAFDTFRNSTGYQFRLNEGLDAVSSAYAGIGGFQSGAAERGIYDYAAGQADNTFGQYAGLLSGQQAVGAGSASALAGVGQNFAGTVINSNNQNATNQINAQLGQQNGFANALGTIGGSILGGVFG